MKIESVTIENFRGYSDKVTIYFNNLTAFVGKNDVGKSTILEALDIFFNDGKGIVKIDKNDINIERVNNDDFDTVISVVFDELPDIITLDAISTTSLKKEYLLNSAGKLEIKKIYHNAGNPKIYICAYHPTNHKCSDLLLKKNNELKRIVKSENIECDKQTSNVELRNAIWKHYCDDLQLAEVDLDANKEDAKKIWDKLSSYMPVYSLFQSDRNNSDSDSEIQDPLQAAVKEIINDNELQKVLSNVAKEVTDKLREVSLRTLEKLQEMDPAVAQSLKPVIPEVGSLKWADVFKKVSISGDENIPINKRGSGVKRLILLNFFRAAAEKKLHDGANTGIVYAIEEPECSQHAHNQRILISALKKLSAYKNTQIIMTTHSGVIVKELSFSNLRLISNIADKKSVVEVQPGVLQYPSLNEVNYVAFSEPSEEYHDELYGYIEHQGWMGEYKQHKTQYSYIQEDRNHKLFNKSYVKTEIIRHQIHHPENTHNVRYTSEELRDSIEEMRAFITSKIDLSELWGPFE